MASLLPPVTLLTLTLVAACPALAQEESHARRFFEHLALYNRAKECVEPPHICSAMRQRVASAACDPPFIRLSFTPKQAIKVRGRIAVGENGQVKSVEITRSSHIVALDHAIAESLSDCSLGVITKDGKPIGSSFEIEWTLHDNTTIISRPKEGS